MIDTELKNRIIFESDSWLAVNKPGGIPSLPDITKDKSLIEQVSDYLGLNLLPVNRIDRPVSGIILFGKTRQAASHLSRQFMQSRINKEYLAITEQSLKQESSVLLHYHRRHSKAKKALIRDNEQDGYHKVKLTYQHLGKSDRYHLYLLRTEQGRFHQIRSQLAKEHAIIKGDIKYGARRKNHDRSICLHAWTLQCKNPDNRKFKAISAPLPPDNLWQFFTTFTEGASKL